MSETTNFRVMYKDEMVKKIKALRPELSEEKIEQLVKQQIKKRENNKKCKLENQETNIISLIKFIRTNNCIMSPYGTLFQNHKDGKNILSEMVDMLLKERKVAKKEMFKHANDEDKTMYNNFKQIQLTLKLLANSFYGASIESNSIFYHPYFGPSITIAGRMIIQTAVSVFERFVANNIIFRTQSDILEYMSDILLEDRNIDLDVNNVDKDFVYEYLIDKLDVKEECHYVKLALDSLDQEDLNRIYYKNNLNEIINNSGQLKELMSHVVAKDDFLDPNEPPAHYQEYTSKIWSIIKEWVYYNKLDFYREDNAENKVRKAILTINY